MIAIINILYVVLLISYLLTSFFIIYHLVRYSIHSSLNYIALVVFIAVSIPLVISNILLFSYVNWSALLANVMIL